MVELKWQMVLVPQFVFAHDFPTTHNRDLTENLLIRSANCKRDLHKSIKLIFIMAEMHPFAFREATKNEVLL